MIICKNCGVELEADMVACPLCGEPAGKGETANKSGVSRPDSIPAYEKGKMSRPQKRFTWEIISVTLLSGGVATIAINLIIDKHITWSEYTSAVCLTIFSYVSVFAFLDQRVITKIVAGFILSSLFFTGLDAVLNNINWPLRLGIPVLFAASLVTAVLTFIINSSKYKGINLIAYAFIASVVLCMCIDAIFSFYKTGGLHLEWSVIVAACTIPVVIVLFLIHYRLKRGRSLERTFHI